MSDILRLTLHAPPFSINSAYYIKGSGKSSTKIRTRECRAWGDDILIQLQRYQKEMTAFRDNFDIATNAIQISLRFLIPEGYYYTNLGTISMRSKDLTNIEKLLVDLIFDERFHLRSVGDIKVQNLNINDKLIVDLYSSKRPTRSEFRIEVEIVRIDNEFELDGGYD